MIVKSVRIGVLLVEYGVPIDILMEGIANGKTHFQGVVQTAVFKAHPQVSMRITLSLCKIFPEPVPIVDLGNERLLPVEQERERTFSPPAPSMYL